MIEYFLPILITTGLVVSFFDFKYGKISNYAILFLIFLGIAFQFLSKPSLAAFAYTIFYGLFTCFLLWFVGIWPAGDAKLFWAFLFFFPTKYYLSPNLTIDFLFNAFVPIFLFMFVIILYRSKLGLLKEAIAYALDPYKITMVAVMLTGFVWLVSQAVFLAGIPPNYFVYLIILFVAFELLRKFFTFKTELAFLALAVLRMVLDFKNVYSLSFAYNLILMMAVFVFLRFFILYLAFKTFTKQVDIKDLKAGMIPAEGISGKNEKFEKTYMLEMSLIGFFSKKKEKFIHSMTVLSERDVEKIKRLKNEKKLPFNSLAVSQTQPFALFIFLGYMITLIAKGSFLAALL